MTTTDPSKQDPSAFIPKSAEQLEETEKADGLGVDPRVIALLKKEYGGIIGLKMEDSGEVLIFRKPPRNVYFRFVNKLSDKDPKKQAGSAEALEELACSCLVYPIDGKQNPDYDKARSYFREYPAAAFTVAGDLTDLAGGSDSAEAKKL